jgi:uncharacterized protein (DUF2062 family)
MLFKRRETESFLARMRVHLWPRRSWSRSSRYVVYRLRRVSATPHAVALGFAAGVFSATTPFLGTHIAMSILIAWIAGGSIIAAVLGTFIGNPLTYPFIWYATYSLGSFMLGNPGMRKKIDLSNGIFQASLDHLWPILKPMTLGTIPVGLGASALAYVLVRPAVEAYQNRRRREFEHRQRNVVGAQ